MPAEIALTGLAANDPIPGEFSEVIFAAGPASSGTATYAALLVGGCLAAGSCTKDTVVYGPDTMVTLSTEADAIALFGAGSELHRMFRRFATVNSTTPLYALAVTEGGSAAAATGTITLTGTATGPATLRIYVGDEYVDTGIATGDTPTVQGANAIANINSKTWWPVTATNAAGVLTLTAKQKGLRSNLVRYWAQLKPTTSGVTVTPTTSTLSTAGTVADSNATALATILAKRFYYIVSAAEDATQIGALLAQVNTQALPTSGIIQRVFGASVDTISNALTIATGLNGARAEVAWLAQSDVPPCELAAMAAAAYSLEETAFPPRCNFDSYGDDSQTSTNWRLKAPMSGAAPTRAQLVSALNGGLTPIGVRTNGSTYIVSRITTRSLNGAVADYRIRDAHKVTVSDFFNDQLKAKEAAQMRGKVIGDDPKVNEPEPSAIVVSPKVYRALINRLLHDFAEAGLLQQVEVIIAATIVQRSTQNLSRMTSLIPLRPVDVLHQVAASIQQVA